MQKELRSEPAYWHQKRSAFWMIYVVVCGYKCLTQNQQSSVSSKINTTKNQNTKTTAVGWERQHALTIFKC